MNPRYRTLLQGLPIVLVLVLLASVATAQTRTYTLDADFDEGALINVNHNAPNNDQLQLNEGGGAFKFIWIAASARGTVIKVDTETGDILGEYRSAPVGRGQNPSRTTVDSDGNVWYTNRDEGGFVTADAIAAGVPAVNRAMGSVAKIGLVENDQCEDRNGNGTIETSTGLGDIKPWPNTGGADDLGGVSTAEDECILHYTRVNARGTRHVSVNASNDVWVSGTIGQFFDLVDGDTGMIVRQEPSVGFGGYGGLIDGNGVIWSARGLLRWDTALPLTGPNGDPAGLGIGPPAAGTNWAGETSLGDSYGLCIDPNDGSVWNTQLSGNRIHKYATDGSYIGAFAHGNNWAQGCVVDSNGDVWVAHSLIGGATTVGHILADGTYVGNVTVGSGPTGMAVDADGKVWSANINSNSASRIDPALGGLGADGVTPIGAVDLTVDLGAGAGPYNYSDMTGSTLVAAPNNGNWTVVYNSGTPGAEWGVIDWNDAVPGDAALSVTVASSADGVTFGAPMAVTNGADVAAADGQYLRVSVAFVRSSGGMSPILYDLTVRTVDGGRDDEAPVCGRISVVREGRGKVLTSVSDNVGIVRAEVRTLRNLEAFFDGVGPYVQGDTYDFPAPTSAVAVMAERVDVANRRAALVIRFFDAAGNFRDCDPVVDQLAATADAFALGQNAPNPVGPEGTTIPFSLAESGPVRLAVYDALGREVAVVADGEMGPGAYALSWDGSDAFGRSLAPGVYVVRLTAGAFEATRRLVLVR